MTTTNTSTELRGLRRLLPWSTRNFMANKLLEWSGSFADAAMWIAPEIRAAWEEDDDRDADPFATAYRADDRFTDLPF